MASDDDKLFAPFRGRMEELIRLAEEHKENRTPQEQQAFEAIKEAALLLDQKLPANMTFFVYATNRERAIHSTLTSANPVYVIRLLAEFSNRWKQHLINLKAILKPKGSA